MSDTGTTDELVPYFTVAGEHDPGSMGVFSAMVHEIFDAAPLDAHSTEPMTFTVWHLGTTMVGRFAGPPTRFTRDRAQVARTGLDQLLVQLYVAGGFRGLAGDRPIQVDPGDVCVFDLSDTLATTARAFDNISILIPREIVEKQRFGASVLHGLVLRRGSTLASILGDHLRSLIDNMATLQVGQARFVAAAALTLITTILAAAARDASPSPAVGSSASPLRSAIAHIDAHIGDPELDVDRIVRDLGWSRSVLFRTFKPQGGVERYIRRRRLGGAARDLNTPGEGRRIGEIARRWGFASDAAFSRSFRAAFGISPRAARNHDILASLGDAWSASGDPDVPERFSTWLHGLRYVSDPESGPRDP